MVTEIPDDPHPRAVAIARFCLLWACFVSSWQRSLVWQVDRPDQLVGVDDVAYGADLVVDVDPAEPLPARPPPSADTQPERHEIYTATLRKRLPRFRLPLANDDRDTVLDLHATFARCYDQAGFGGKIDYRRQAPTVLKDDDRRWLDKLLQEQKLR